MNKNLDFMSNTEGIPKYLVVKQELLSAIKAGKYPPSSMIPSENQISKLFQVSVITARKALQELVNAGVVYRIKGKGSFVQAKEEISEHLTGPPEHKMRIITLVLLSYEASDSSTMRIIEGIQSILSKHNYNLTIECSNNNIQNEALVLEKCIANRVDGVLLFSVNPEANIKALKKLLQAHIPFILLDRGVSQLPVSLVTSYNLSGGYLITRHLMEMGHKKLLFAGNEIELETEYQRYKGFSMALNELDVSECSSINHVLDNMEKLLERIREDGYTAVVCVNDKCAVKVMKTLKKAGYHVPEDISVTGFDNADFGKYISPALTTIEQPFGEMGQIAAQKLINQIEGIALGPSQEILPVKLVIRQSVQKID